MSNTFTTSEIPLHYVPDPQGMVEQCRDSSSTADWDGDGAELSLDLFVAGFLMVVSATHGKQLRGERYLCF